MDFIYVALFQPVVTHSDLQYCPTFMSLLSQGHLDNPSVYKSNGLLTVLYILYIVDYLMYEVTG
jgi:hypothetical protein